MTHPPRAVRRLTNRARTWFRATRDESSNSFVMFVFLLPIIMGGFGMGVDLSRNAYIRTTIQNNLEIAAVGGASTAMPNDTGNVVLTPETALAAIEETYDYNRTAVTPFLDCGDGGATVGTTSRTRCWQTWEEPVITDNYISYGIVERSRNAFLPVIGITWQSYHVKATARVVQDTQ